VDRGGRSRGAADAAAAAGLALAAVGPALWAPDRLIGDGVDLYGTVWFYAWIHRCLQTGADPGFTDLMFHPLGKDILAHTGNNFLDAILAAPLISAVGLQRGITLTIALILWLNAMAMRAALGPLRLAPGLRLTLSLAFAINPFVTTELLAGRPTQALVAFTPLALGWTLRLGAAGPRGAVPLALGVGLAVALQGWTYWFAGAFCGGAVAAVGLARALSAGPDRRRAVLGGLVVAGLTCLTLIAPGVLAVVAAGGGMGEAPGGGLLDLPASVGNNVQQELYGIAHVEANGLPILLRALPLALALVAAARPAGRPWLLLAAGASLLALGPRLPWGDLPNLPYALLHQGVPHWDRLWFPYRIAMISVVAVFFGAAAASRGRRGPGPTALALGLLLIAGLDAARWGGLPLLWRPLQAPEALLALRARPGGLIELPIGLARESIAHQAIHGLPTFGGMAENAPFFWPEGHRQRLGHPLIKALRDPVRRPIPARGGTPAQLDRVRGWGMRYVVLDRQLLFAELSAQQVAAPAPETADPRAAVGGAVGAISAALGAPIGEAGALVVWDLACIRPAPSDPAPCSPLGTGGGGAWGDPPARTLWEELLLARGQPRAPR
jgi:hypothetical protein